MEDRAQRALHREAIRDTGVGVYYGSNSEFGRLGAPSQRSPSRKQQAWLRQAMLPGVSPPERLRRSNCMEWPLEHLAAANAAVVKSDRWAVIEAAVRADNLRGTTLARLPQVAREVTRAVWRWRRRLRSPISSPSRGTWGVARGTRHAAPAFAEPRRPRDGRRAVRWVCLRVCAFLVAVAALRLATVRFESAKPSSPGESMTRRASVRMFLALPAALVLSQCQGSEAPSGPTGSGLVATERLGPDGGSVRLLQPRTAGDASATSEAVLIGVPAGALEEPLELRVASLQERPPVAFASESPLYEFGPAGTRFTVPVTVRIAVDGASAPDGSLSIFWSKYGSSSVFEALPTHRSGDFFEAEVAHFSRGFVAPTAAADVGNIQGSTDTDAGGARTTADAGSGTDAGAPSTADAGSRTDAGGPTTADAGSRTDAGAPTNADAGNPGNPECLSPNCGQPRP